MASAWIPSSRDLPRSFWIVWFGTLVNRAGAFVAPFLALYLVGERGMHIERVGEIIALVGLGSLAAGPLGGTLADRLGRRRALAASSLLGSAAMIALSATRQPSAIAAGALSLGLFGDMYRPISASIIADVVAPAYRARAYGLRRRRRSRSSPGTKACQRRCATCTCRQALAIRPSRSSTRDNSTAT